MQYIAFDSHKHYTFARVENEEGILQQEVRINHERGKLGEFLNRWERKSPVAVETVGNWYWIVDEIEAAGMEAKLVHARKAKLMMGMVNKTDKLDAKGMNQLQRAGTLPTVWIPPGDLRDRRDLARTRMVLLRQRTQLKNRIHATLAKYALSIDGVSDAFGVKGRELIRQRIRALPPQTQYVTERLMESVEYLNGQLRRIEERMEEVFEKTPEVEHLMTMPGVGFLSAVVIAQEVGNVGRFASAEKLAAYAGTTPRVHSSGGKTRYGRLRPDVSKYLRWAFIEAGNAIAANRHHWPERHVARRYEQIRHLKGHQKAVGAVARHLAEATYWMLTKNVDYREPIEKAVLSKRA
jgi:transposase